MALDNIVQENLSIGGVDFQTSRMEGNFGLFIDGPAADSDKNRFPNLVGGISGSDYLHQHLLTPENRGAFFDLISHVGLVICRNVVSDHETYRKVRGKSSAVKLSQAEYYHHDGCSCPENPRVVEIRLPHQDFDRNVATAIAPFPSILRAMLQALPENLLKDPEVIEFQNFYEGTPFWNFDRGSYMAEGSSSNAAASSSNATASSFDGDYRMSDWEKIQGRLTRIARHNLDAESCRSYFREVDQLANAYVLPWQMGESRLMLNNHHDLACTMQHRRSYQKRREMNEQNGSLVKRWPAEEL